MSRIRVKRRKGRFKICDMASSQIPLGLRKKCKRQCDFCKAKQVAQERPGESPFK